MKTLTRKQIREGLEQVPMTELLGVSDRALTGKQKEFAKGLALGKTKADAYRQSHKKDATRATITTEPYKLASDPRIALEVEAYKLAIESAKHRTPAALRELVIQSLVQVVIDPEAKQATKVQAAKVLGTVTEVAAFTERKEIRTIRSSEDTKAQIMAQLRQMLNAGAEDATFIEADTLLKELAGDETSYRSLTASWFEHSPLHQALKKIADKKSSALILANSLSNLISIILSIPSLNIF